MTRTEARQVSRCSRARWSLDGTERRRGDGGDLTPPSWVEGAAGSGFDVDHLPYGVFATADEEPRVGVRIGGYVVDLAPVAAASFDVHVGLFEQPTLNAFMATGAEEWARVRSWLQDLLVDPAAEAMVGPHLVPV